MRIDFAAIRSRAGSQLKERIAAGLPDPQTTSRSINRQAADIVVTIEMMQGIQPDPMVAALVSSAANATERFSDDELEAYAATMKGTPCKP